MKIDIQLQNAVLSVQLLDLKVLFSINKTMHVYLILHSISSFNPMKLRHCPLEEETNKSLHQDMIKSTLECQITVYVLTRT